MHGGVPGISALLWAFEEIVCIVCSWHVRVGLLSASAHRCCWCPGRASHAGASMLTGCFPETMKETVGDCSSPLIRENFTGASGFRITKCYLPVVSRHFASWGKQE